MTNNSSKNFFALNNSEIQWISQRAYNETLLYIDGTVYFVSNKPAINLVSDCTRFKTKSPGTKGEF